MDESKRDPNKHFSVSIYGFIIGSRDALGMHSAIWRIISGKMAGKYPVLVMLKWGI
jgi:hypothetical protein